jgi:hypothetical protein
MSIHFKSIRPTAADVARNMRGVNETAVTHSYFVVMRDHGRLGREAIVDPEITRRGVVSRIVSGEYSNIIFIHAIADGGVTDVTLELQLEASVQQEAA